MGLVDKLQIPAHAEIHKAFSQVQQKKETEKAKEPPKSVPEVLSGLQDPCTALTCPHTARGPHYHCAKCQFWAIDTTKLALHIKQHMKQDQVAALGFERVSPTAACYHPNCPFTAQVHYHCLSCNHIALNQLQMTMHKAQAHQPAIMPILV